MSIISGVFAKTRPTWLRQKFTIAAKDSVTFFGVTMIALLWIGAYYNLERDYHDDLNRAKLNATNLAQHFEESTLRVFGNADRVLRMIRDRIAVESNPALIPDLLKQAASVSDLTFQLAIIDAKGILRYSSVTGSNTKPLDLSDREHFKVHVATKDDTIFISKPVLGRATGKWAIQVTRKLRNATGEFAGVIVLSLDPTELSRPFNDMNFGALGLVVLAGTDGIVRARSETAPFAMGDNLIKSTFGREVAGNRHGTFLGITAKDNVRRLVSYRSVRGSPLVIAVGLAEDDILADFRNSRIWQLVGAVILTLVIAFAVGLSLMHRARFKSARVEVYLSQRRERKKTIALQATLDNISHGIIMVGDDRIVNVINRQAIELLGLEERFLRPGYTFDELVDRLVEMGEFNNADGSLDETIVETVRGVHEASLSSRFERRRPNGRVFEVKTKGLSEGGFLRTITDITRRRDTESKLLQLARQDSLTVLANRAVLREELERLLGDASSESSFAVHCIDLDRFKNVNDTLGHPVGDRLLQQVADRLRAAVRSDDVVARLGGDEFAIIQRHVATEAMGAALAERIVRLIGQPFDVDGNSIVVGASVGIALAPRDGRNADDVLKNADMALYRAKSSGRGTHRFFAVDMQMEVQARRSIELDLRAAVIEREFELHYQPLVDTRTGGLNGFEALIRWRHPVKGMISPLDFIPIAEDLRLITTIGAWVIREACSRAAEWPEHIKVAVNLSPVQFESGDLVQVVSDAISSAGLTPSRLELEITESTLLKENDSTLTKLQQLRKLGVRISMDDFGTGYSALSYLLSYPFDKIKIDRTFVKGLGTAAGSESIVGAIVELARKLGMSTTAEGVETPAQFAALSKLQCNEAQGYLFSAPRPICEVASMITKFTAKSRAA